MKIKIKIQNCSNGQMSITKEPEALEAFIASNEIIEIETNDQEDNISINVGKNDDGSLYVQVWDAINTSYLVMYKGKNMFEEYL